ncbi:hypothetical protein JCM10213v2_006774, partial [Rhodosporidiobolus nylandii]
YDPNAPALFPFAAQPQQNPFTPTTQPPASWMPFLGSFAPAPTDPSPTSMLSAGGAAWSTSLSTLVTPFTPHPPSHPLPPAGLTSEGYGEAPSSGPELNLANPSAWLQTNSPPFDLSALLRSPTPPQPFSPVLFPTTSDLSLPLVFTDLAPRVSGAPAAHPVPVPAGSEAADELVTSPDGERVAAFRHGQGIAAADAPPIAAAVSQAASLLISADFAFTRAYLLSHYTTSLAHVVSLASATGEESSTAGSSRSHSSDRPFSHPTARHSSSTTSGANLFLSLVPLAHRNASVMNAILSWSAANIAAASHARTAEAGEGTDGHSVMATLSDELGRVAETSLEEEMRVLQQQLVARERVGASAAHWEAILAARVMLMQLKVPLQASICRGDVARWRVRLREAASVVSLVGGVAACKSALSRQLVRNLLYHDALSSTAAKEGPLLDWGALSGGRAGRTGPRGAAAEGSTPVSTEDEEEDVEDEEGVLDTLFGIAQGTLAKEKRQAVKRGGDAVAEDDLALFLSKVEESRLELEREKERADALIADKPELASHRYLHEAFRLAALIYLNMILEMAPRALPMLLLTRKMLSLVEVIVSENLPGLCSMHWPLYIMHLNSTPLISPHASVDDRERSTRLFDAHMKEFSFLNTRRSRELVAEVWKRSTAGRSFVDPDDILHEWAWELNYA